MKFTAVVLSTLAAGASAMKGQKASELVSQARRLNDADNQEIDMTWANDFSVKYQGCHHIKQWNGEANGQDDVRIYTKRLVRFRLCPSDECSADAAGGCQSGYGDYIVDMDTYLQMYWNAKQEDDEMDCQEYFNDYCGDCEGNDDEQGCFWECAVNGGKEDCVEGGDPNNDGEQEEQINYEEFMQCKNLGGGNNNNNNNNNNNGNNGQEVEYYAGPYCSEQGGAIKIGVFTDDQCTEFAEGMTFYQLTGMYNMYTEESLVSESCVRCEEREEDDGNNNNNNNQNEEAKDPREFCTELYDSAGKCETYMGSTLGEYNINEQGCNYLSGIKMVRSDGLLDVSDARPSAIATAFIVIFAMAFAAMAFYVWYLRTRLGVKKNSLL